ncbi:hypothetical protein [Enterocloster lavalensis]|uniref:hypothetical protein n=1 Tax=Enterocloster lavalensis TaxID=460384 RepID=UPI000D1B45AA|nr:hypothetical protein [Enterocloster lavalensis]PST32546.1 hypothetical protein C7256_15300 [Enterocloster lavalensis]
MKKENAEKLLGWAREAQRIFTESGETDFLELIYQEHNEIVDELINVVYCEYDGDYCDISYARSSVDTVTVIFYGFNDYTETDELRTHLIDIEIRVGGTEMNLDEFVAYLEHQLTAKTEIVNLTPHEITVYNAAGESVLQVIPSSGMARAAQI